MQEFEGVYQQYFGQIYRFLFRMTGSIHIAEELTHRKNRADPAFLRDRHGLFIPLSVHR